MQGNRYPLDQGADSCSSSPDASCLGLAYVLSQVVTRADGHRKSFASDPECQDLLRSPIRLRRRLKSRKEQMRQDRRVSKLKQFVRIVMVIHPLKAYLHRCAPSQTYQVAPCCSFPFRFSFKYNLHHFHRIILLANWCPSSYLKAISMLLMLRFVLV